MKHLFNTIFPMLANRKANSIIRKKLDESIDSNPKGVLSEIENTDKISLDILKEQYNDTIRAKGTLEDKAKTNIIGITLSITLIMGGSGVLSSLNDKYPFTFLTWVLFTLFVISVTYMITAGLLVIKLLTDENLVYTINLNSFSLDEKKLKEDYSTCTSLNQMMNTIRNNYIFSSYECIRNALICLFIILIFVTVPLTFDSKNSATESSYNDQTYSFVFSSSAVDYIKQNDVRDVVEKSIANEIKKSELTEDSQTFGIIDAGNNLFIKFEINNDNILVLLIEPYTSP
jgi:hypothetical protein